MKKQDQSTLTDPREAHYSGKYPRQEQPAPGIEEQMKPRPDTGEESYRAYGRLKGRKALITGGDSGIGRTVAIAFSREGADVAVNYLEAEQEDADTLREDIAAHEGTVYLLPGDLRQEQTSRRIVCEAAEKLGGLDILVLNAGRQIAQHEVGDISTEQLREVFETNVFAMYWMTQEAVPLMKEGASIITTSSIEAFQPNAHLLDYAATKSAIVGFTRALAKQLAEKGIRVNSVAPGPIWTPLQISGGQFPEKIPEFGQNSLLKRAGQPVEVAPVYVFLASDESSFITGEVIGVTGGK